ncbi:hypothetical protein ZIOFF_009753 [Zingiber officinale]|uniref:Transposase-associated domain-containing protein n=1 Tax=Zingiber officinale TaxID=94328 RepID=A0A8J5LRN6_ZINOF|nr:hypothetical protein ZIOFF_009753 [Zingiber officinale]
MDWPRASLGYQWRSQSPAKPSLGYALVGYRVGILNFLRFAFVDSADEVKKPCACRKCINSSNHDRPTMHEHQTIYGMLQDYHIWDFHEEKPMVQSRDSMCSVLHASSRENNDEDNHNLVVQEMTSRADEADATIPTAPMKLNTDNSLHQPCLYAITCKTSLLRLHCFIPCGRKDPCPYCAGIGNASDDIHNIAMAEDELSDDDMQAGEEEAVIMK